MANYPRPHNDMSFDEWIIEFDDLIQSYLNRELEDVDIYDMTDEQQFLSDAQDIGYLDLKFFKENYWVKDKWALGMPPDYCYMDYVNDYLEDLVEEYNYI